MEIKKLILFVIVVSFFVSCNSKTEKSDSTAEISTGSNEKEELKRIEKSGGSFYDWYFKNDFKDWDVVKGKDGYCLLDTVSYFKRLRSFGTISEEFIKSERERLQGCAEFIATIEYDVYENTEGDEYYKYCSFLYYKDWFMSQDPFGRFSVKEVKKIDSESASVAIYVSNDNSEREGLLANVFLKKEGGDWKIVKMKLDGRDEFKNERVSVKGRWGNGELVLYVSDDSVVFKYHAQCLYFYPIRKISESEFEMIWSEERDCKLIATEPGETFGLKSVPKIGKPFGRFKLKNDILYFECYYKDWLKVYTNKEGALFPGKYFIPAEEETDPALKSMGE